MPSGGCRHRGLERALGLMSRLGPWLGAVLVVVLALGAAPAAAAPGEAGLPLLRIFNAAGHVSSSQNWAIVQDRRGVMYFGSTDDGVLEFDGVSWRTIPTPHRTTIRSLALGADGRIYVGGIGEIGYLAPDAAGRMSYVSLLDRVPEADREFADVWSTLATAQGVYFTTFKKLIRIGAPGPAQVWRAGTSFHIAHMARERLYVREVGRGLMQLVDDQLQPVPQGERLADEKIAAVLPWPRTDGSGDDALLIGTRTKGFFLLEDGRLRRWQTEADAVLESGQLYTAIRLADGRVAGGTLMAGVVLFDAKGRLAGRLERSTGLPGPTVYSLLQDRRGSLWLAMDKGIVRADVAAPLTQFGPLSGVQGNVIAIHRHQGILYVGSTQGLYRLQPAATGGHFVPVPQVSGQTWVLRSLGDILLVGGAQGVHELRHGRWRLVRPSTQNTVALAQSTVNPERVYVGMMDGLASMHLQGSQWVDEGRVGDIDEEVRSIVQDADGRVWLGTFSAGVIALPPETPGALGPLARVQARRFGAAEGLPVGPVFVWEIQGQPAFASTRGTLRFDAKQAAFVSDPRFAGLFKDGPRQVFDGVEDEQGNLWMYSQDATRTLKESGVARPLRDGSGAYRWDPRPTAEIADLSQALFLADEGGVMWIGVGEGIYRLDRHAPGADADADPEPALVRRVAGRDGSLQFGGAGAGTTPDIAFERNALRFEFASPSFGQRPPRYQVMLQGLDRDWSAPMAETYLDYTNLREGDYRFRVRAIDPYGHVSRESGWSFRILPPWYRTPLAYLAYVMATVLAVLGLAGWRSAALRARNRHLAQLVATQTRELSEANRALQSANTSLAEISLTDALTGLKNRRYLAERIAEDMAALRRSHTQATRAAQGAAPADDAQLTFIMVDIDHFKQINDQYGHDAGDRVLEQFGSILRSICRDTDTAVRWGGEEFLVVARHTPVETGMALAERIRMQVAAHPFVLDDGRVLQRTCSLGFAGFPLYPAAPERMSWEVSVKLADQCLYEAKHGGRNAWVGVRPTTQALPAHGAPPSELASAVAQGWLELLRMPELASQLAVSGN